MPVTLENLVAGELVSARRSKISANFAALVAWITGTEANGLVKTFAAGAALPTADQGLIWHADFMALMSWRTIGAYTGYASMELGKVLHFDAAAAPAGWLACTGQSIAGDTKYDALAALRGSTTLRDLRGEFIRGLDSGRGVDTGRVLGSAQGHAFQTHEHKVADYHQTAGGVAVDAAYASVAGAVTLAANKNTLAVVAGASTATETRPRNVALLACIKF